MSKFTTADKIKCAKRELAMRKAVYPGWVRAGKLKPKEAEREIAIMQDIIDEYTEIEKKERLL